jgi:hypothetical protein
LPCSNYIGEEINQTRIIFVAPDIQTKRNEKMLRLCQMEWGNENDS